MTKLTEAQAKAALEFLAGYYEDDQAVAAVIDAAVKHATGSEATAA